jgi:hypothetical protein
MGFGDFNDSDYREDDDKMSNSKYDANANFVFLRDPQSHEEFNWEDHNSNIGKYVHASREGNKANIGICRTSIYLRQS